MTDSIEQLKEILLETGATDSTRGSIGALTRIVIAQSNKINQLIERLSQLEKAHHGPIRALLETQADSLKDLHLNLDEVEAFLKCIYDEVEENSLLLKNLFPQVKDVKRDKDKLEH